jgi:TQXA domain-containing protein
VGRISTGRWGRLSAAVVLGGLMSFTAAGMAAAADDTKTTPVKGVASSGRNTNYPLFDGEGNSHGVRLITLTIGDEPVRAYCIDLHHDLNNGGDYQETKWKASTVTGLAKVQWILGHSVPNVPAAKVLEAAGATRPAGMKDDDELENLVYSATQGAIWHFSDGLEVADRDKPNYDVLKKVYEYFKTKAGTDKEPAPTLSIAPATATGEIGAKLGPFTVTSSFESAKLAASGGKLVDAAGAPVTGSVSDGTKFWLTSDKAGKVTVDATARGTVPSGRVFTAVQKPNEYQKVILAGTAKTKLVAHAVGTFTPKGAKPPIEQPPANQPPGAQPPGGQPPAAGPSLPVTGPAAVGAAVGGVALLGAGGALVMTLRRRRVKFTA